MTEISPELKEQARQAQESNKHYTLTVSGETYPIHEDLRSWGMMWVPEERVWRAEYCSAFQKFLFERHVADGDWKGVKIEAIEEKDEFEIDEATGEIGIK